MSLLVNIRHLETENVTLEGKIPLEALDLGITDDLVHPADSLEYDLEAQELDDGILVQGSLKLPLKCECARCLKPFDSAIDLQDWACLLPFQGEDAVAISNDRVDLTPYVREDILLSVPQHPLCEPECRGLMSPKKDSKTGVKQQTSSAWAELNKLKL